MTLKAQPDGLLNERCTAFLLYSIHNLDGWHDIACAYNKIHSYICETPAQHYGNGNINNSFIKKIKSSLNIFNVL